MKYEDDDITIEDLQKTVPSTALATEAKNVKHKK